MLLLWMFNDRYNIVYSNMLKNYFCDFGSQTKKHASSRLRISCFPIWYYMVIFLNSLFKFLTTEPLISFLISNDYNDSLFNPIPMISLYFLFDCI